jgi:hypothetical protein
LVFDTVEERFRGDTIEFDFYFTRGGAPLDITAAQKIWCTGKVSTNDADAEAEFQKTLADGIIITDGPGGVARIRIAPEDTSDIVITNDGTVNLQVDVAIKLPAADQYTAKRFILPLVADVTRATS